MDLDFEGCLHFEGFELDINTQELRRGGQRVPLQLQPLKLLTQLALSRGQIVSRESLRTLLWSNRTFVDFEAGLNFCVRQIRKALGEDARKPKMLETLNRRGYRFLAPVERVNPISVGPLTGERRITVTFPSKSALDVDSLEVERLAKSITQLLIASYRTEAQPYSQLVIGSPVTTLGSPSSMRSGAVGLMPQRGYPGSEVRISRGPAAEQYLAVVRVE